MYKNIFFLIVLSFFSSKLLSKSLDVQGLSKLNLSDIQSITSLDIYNENLGINDINIFLKELSLSELIYEIDYTETENQYILRVVESNLIENIYINNNSWIKDDLILQNLNSKVNSQLTKNKIQKDIKTIKTIYKTKGFLNISVISTIEKYSEDRVNLIYKIEENQQQKINMIRFIIC